MTQQSIWAVSGTEPSQLAALGKLWDPLSRDVNSMGSSYMDIVDAESNAENFWLLIRGAASAPASMMAIRVDQVKKPFAIGERRIGAASIHRGTIVGGQMVGQCDAEALAECLLYFDSQVCRPDIFSLGEVPVHSAMHDAVQRLGRRFYVSSPSRVDQIHWYIKLPSSFDEYMTTLGSETRQSIRRKVRKFDKDLDWSLDLVTSIEQIDKFLEAGETISRQTYQWQVGQRLENNESTRLEYRRRAESRTLRAYLLKVEGVPWAFLRGTLVGSTYHYETPGFLPEYSQWSVGNVLLMHVVKELIENTDCKLFDFGEGGDASGYKAKFGNHSETVRVLEIACVHRLRGLTLLVLQSFLCATKNIAQMVLGDSVAKRRIKGWLRPRMKG